MPSCWLLASLSVLPLLAAVLATFSSNAMLWTTKTLAWCGSQQAQYEMFLRSMTANGVPWSLETGIEWLQLSAERYCPARVTLGKVFHDTNQLELAVHSLIGGVHCSCDCALKSSSLVAAQNLNHACSPTQQMDSIARGLCVDSAVALADILYHNFSDAVNAASAYQIAAFRGSGVASFRLGVLFANGWSNPDNHPNGTILRPRRGLSHRMFQRAAVLGHTDGLFNMAVEAHAKQNMDLAVRWYALASMQGDTEAMRVLGHLLAEGDGSSSGVTTDLPTAVPLLYCAHLRGDSTATDAIRHLILRYGKTVVLKLASAVQELNFCGGNGSGKEAVGNQLVAFDARRTALMSASDMRDGLEIVTVAEPSPPKTPFDDMMNFAAELETQTNGLDSALKIYQDLARSHPSESEPLLRIAKITRRGSPSHKLAPNPAGALPVLKQALERESARAVYEVALVGEALGWDSSTVLSLYLHAAELKVADALFNLGVMYMTGSNIVPQDESESRRFFEDAAACGDAEAMLFAAKTTLQQQHNLTSWDSETKIRTHAYLNVALSRGLLCAESPLLQLERAMSGDELVGAHVRARVVRKASHTCDQAPHHVLRRTCEQVLQIIKEQV